MIQNPEIKLKNLRELKNLTQEYMAQQLVFQRKCFE
jgi:hypothetical protein